MSVAKRSTDEAVPWPVRAAAGWSWRALLIGAAVTGILYLLWMFRLVTLPVFAALLLSAILHPPVAWAHRRGLPRLLATSVAFFGGIALVGLIFYGLGEFLAAGFSDLNTAFTGVVSQLRRWLESGPLSIGSSQLTDQIQQWLQSNSQRIGQGLLATATTTVQLLAGLLLALVVTFFFLFDGNRIWAWVIRLFPANVEERIDGAGRRAWESLAGYVQGTLVVALFDAVLISIILFLVGLPPTLALPLGVLIFFAAFVPLIGALVTGVFAVLVTLVTQGMVPALIVLGGVIAVQQIEGNLLQPLVLGRMVRLHPIAILLSVTAGSIVAGIAGAIVAVPLAAVINTTAAFLLGREEKQPTGTSRSPSVNSNTSPATAPGDGGH